MAGRIWAGAAPGHSCRAHPISTQDCQEAPGRCCATKGQSIRGSAAETALRNLWLLEYSQCLVELVRYHFKSLLTALIHLLSTRIPNELSALVRRPWRLHWQKPTPQLFFPNMCNMHCSAICTAVHCTAWQGPTGHFHTSDLHLNAPAASWIPAHHRRPRAPANLPPHRAQVGEPARAP